MIVAYIVDNNELKQKILLPGDEILSGIVWIDMFKPTSEEEKWVEKSLGINAPTHEEMGKIEVMSPFYKEGNAYYMTVTVLKHLLTDDLQSSAMTFILTPSCLVTLHYVDNVKLLNFAATIYKNPYVIVSPDAILMGVLDMLLNNMADTLETIGNELDALLNMVFENPVKKKVPSPNYYNGIISKIGRTGSVISKNRESLVSINRLLLYFSQMEQLEKSGFMFKKEQRLKMKHINRELYSLSEYANFLAQRTAFLLDATLGMLSVEQNMVIKVFTVAAAIFFPPTLIASIYGMNFGNMPELNWPLGYPIALFLMMLSSVLPCYFFKKKGWL